MNRNYQRTCVWKNLRPASFSVVVALALTTRALSAFTSPLVGPQSAYPKLPSTVTADPSLTPVTGRTLGVHSGDDLQAAIDNAQPGDALVLDANATWTGNYVLPWKSGTGWITIESSDMSDLPSWGTRVDPSMVTHMPTIQSNNTLPAILIADYAHNYRLMGLNIAVAAKTPLSFGLIMEALDPNNTDDNRTPSFIIFDRDYVHGEILCHCKFGIQLNAHYIAVDNCYITEFHGIGQDTQALTGYSNLGPVQIVNNFLEGSGENVIFGGGYDAIPNAISSDIEIRNNHFYKPPAWQNQIIPPPSGLTVTGASGGSLVAGRTYYYSVLAAGNVGYYLNAWDTTHSPGSQEVSFTADSANGSAALAWSKDVYGDANDSRTPDQYLILRTTDAPSATTRHWTGFSFVLSDPTTNTISWRDNGSSTGWWAAGTLSPARWGTRWTVKNLLEFKNGVRILVDGNIFENCWIDGQSGQALDLTPRTENTNPGGSGGAEMANHTIQDLTFTNNVVRHVGEGVVLSSVDNYADPTKLSLIQPPARLYFGNNVWEDISWAYGAAQFWTFEAGMYGVGGASDVIFDHNTVFQDYNFLGVQPPTQPSENFGPFFLTNNIFPNNLYGLVGAPGKNFSSFATMFSSVTASDNVWIGGTANWPMNYYPGSINQVELVSYQNGNGGDYHLESSSQYKGVASDGTDPGANIDTLNANTATVVTGASTPIYSLPPWVASLSAPKISSVTVMWITQGGAVVTWTTDQPSSTQVEYGTSASYRTQTTISDHSGVESHSVVLRGLLPGTVYHFAVISTNIQHETSTSSDQSFRTRSR